MSPKKHHFRASPRPHIECKVVLYREVDAHRKPIAAFTRDVGTGGLFVVTNQWFDMGDKVEVLLSTPSTWEPLVLPTSVCRIEPPEGSAPGGTGFRFEALDDTQTMALAKLIESLDFDA